MNSPPEELQICQYSVTTPDLQFYANLTLHIDQLAGNMRAI